MEKGGKCNHDHGGGDEDHVCNHVDSNGVSQSLDELAFERGIWGTVISGNATKVEALLKKDASLTNKQDNSGYYPLHYAVRSIDNTDIVELLLEYGARVNVSTPGGATPLHRASFCGSIKSCKLLTNKKEDCNIEFIDHQDSDGMTALHKAYQRGHKEIVQLLIAKGSNQEIKDKKQKKPIDYQSS
ncbi:ankyrin repeat-containing protein 39 [Cavenderia fasciculata]|uniref:Ankyrin repeat-containing protein 39 n=1 Tax=Cavenderia fasciculata TaxID=261658 RepID=F4PYK4_CACFS|nr:ankyrin repeat-containing protein 39 [Cavenderia fasciculata]EGG19270.1 ankyrin repeat-containing protein 39 [Cavenderia fasciculata]|eukprot:XP_004357541.1 ankyrin repeat-containing protein 39 [Cavenderia fasciculata]